MLRFLLLYDILLLSNMIFGIYIYTYKYGGDVQKSTYMMHLGSKTWGQDSNTIILMIIFAHISFNVCRDIRNIYKVMQFYLSFSLLCNS